MAKRKKPSIFTLKNKCVELGFKEIPFEESGIEKAVTGNTVLILCYDGVSADGVLRSYQKALDGANIPYRHTFGYLINFQGSGKIVIVYATKKHDFSKYFQTKTYFRLDYRR